MGSPFCALHGPVIDKAMALGPALKELGINSVFARHVVIEYIAVHCNVPALIAQGLYSCLLGHPVGCTRDNKLCDIPNDCLKRPGPL